MNAMEISSLEEVDAMVFSGDALYEKESLEEFEQYLERWKRGIIDIKKTLVQIETEKEASVFSNQSLRRCYKNYVEKGAIDFKRIRVTQLEEDSFALDIYLDDDIQDYHTYLYPTQKEAARDGLELHILSLRENFTGKVEKTI